MIEEPATLTIARNIRRPSKEQVAAFQGISTGYVVDAMFGQGAFDSSIRPLGEGRDINCVAAGPALTANCGPADIMATLASLAFIQPGDVMVSAFADHQGCAAAGDRVTGMLKNNGAAGFVTDGPVRDYLGIVEVGLPVWCKGLTPASPFTKGPGSVGLPIQLAGQKVETGDMIVADRDGVVVVPFDQLDNVIANLENVKSAEAALDQEIVDGLKVPPAILELLDSDAANFVD